MPTQWAHSFYWAGDAVTVPPPDPPSGASFAGYPAWQAGVIAASGFGAFQSWYERLARVWTWARRIWAWTPDQEAALAQWLAEDAAMTPEARQALAKVRALMACPQYAEARAAVRETAMTLGFNKPAAWAKLGQELRGRTNWAENQWRHLHAMKLLDQTCHGWRNPDRNLLVELAYLGYTIKPRD